MSDAAVGRFVAATDEARNNFINEMAADNKRLREAVKLLVEKVDSRTGIAILTKVGILSMGQPDGVNQQPEK